MSYATAKNSSANPGSRLVIVCLLFLVLAGLGFAFVRHQQYLAKQEQLLAYYKAINSWRPAVKPVYDALVPLMDRARNFKADASTHDDAETLSRELAARSKEVQNLQLPHYQSPSDEWFDFPSRIGDLLSGYSAYVMATSGLRSADHEALAKGVATGLASMTNLGGSIPQRYYDAHLKQFEALDDATLRKQAGGMLDAISSQSKWERAKLDQLIDGPPVVPAGLDRALIN